MDERITEHLKHLHRYLLRLHEMQPLSLEAFKKDNLTRAALERYLHLAIESCLNIGNRMLALAQMEKPVRTPETYADIFNELGHLGVLKDPALTERLVRMAKFRNRLVHMYWDIDEEFLYSILQENIVDLEQFKQAVVDHTNKNAPK
jgi:uncharacterized protein YutE (UPF0331/DUF86 family)